MKTRQLFSFFMLICALTLVSCAKDEVVTTGTIAGLVTDYTNANKPIAGASVTMNIKGITKTTGTDGRFEFTDIEPGTYTLQVQANGYQAGTKQVTVYANQTINCDFQLDKSHQSSSVVISPENVVFGGNMETNSFTITNNSSQSLTYSLSSLPSYIQASPNAGNIAAKGQQTIVLTVLNRSTITAQRTDKLLVNVGSDSYPVNVTVEAFQTETTNVSVSPTSLMFDKNTDQLSFTMRNNNTFAHTYSISSDIDFLTMTPKSGTLEAKGTVQVSVTIPDRQTITTSKTGVITIQMSGNSYNVSVSVDKYEEDTPTEDIAVTRGMLAYYNFNDGTANNAWQKNYYGNLKGEETPEFLTDTPNGKGKSLNLLQGQYVDIPSNMLDGKRAYTIGMWVKNFGTGALFSTLSGRLNTPSLYVTSDSKLKVYYNNYYNSSVLNTSLTSYQSSGWHFIVVTAQQDKEVTLYIDGNKMDSKAVDNVECDGAKMQIGGNADGYLDAWADPMIVDNVRIHSVALDANSVKTIYDAEK